MQISAHPCLTAGIAVLGASAIALTTSQPIVAQSALSQAASEALAVNLTSSIDPITPITDMIAAAVVNTTALVNSFIETPFPILLTAVNNWVGYFGELPDIGTIVSQIASNLGKAVQAPSNPGTVGGNADFPGLANGDNISTIPMQEVQTGYPLQPTFELTQKFLYDQLPNSAPDFVTANEGLLNFLNTPLSGVVLGLVGPIVAPFVALGNSIGAAMAAIQASDITGALNALINIPTNMVNALLNGATMNLSSLIGGSLPAGTTVGLALGGLLTTFTSPVDDTQVQVGGVGFDAIAVSGTFPNPLLPGVLPDITINDPGIGIGLVGSLMGLTRSIASAIDLTPATAASGAAKPAARRAPAAARAVAATAKPVTAKAVTAHSAATARQAK